MSMAPDYMIVAEMHRAAFEQGPDAIAIVDDAGTILTVNSQFELLTGRSRATLLGQKMETLLPARLREWHREHWSAYQRRPHAWRASPHLNLAVLQRLHEVPIDVNLAPVTISLGMIVVITIRHANG
jgi:PAS domain S-box-containing protein